MSERAVRRSGVSAARCLAASMLLAALFTPASAWANSAMGLGNIADSYLPFGLNLSYTNLSGDGGGAFTFGTEVSYAQFVKGVDMPIMVGGYTDLLFDVNNRQGRFSFGPELFLTFVGLDGGPVVSFGREGAELGAQGRFVVSAFGAISLFAGGGKHFTGERGGFFTTGVLLKYPMPIK